MGFGLDTSLGVDPSMEKLLEFLRIHAEQSLLLTDKSLFHHLPGGLDFGRGSHLSITRLEDIKLPLLDGEL